MEHPVCIKPGKLLQLYGGLCGRRWGLVRGPELGTEKGLAKNCAFHALSRLPEVQACTIPAHERTRRILADPAAGGDYSGSVDVNRGQYLSRRPVTQDDPTLSVALRNVNFDSDRIRAMQHLRALDLPEV